MSKSDHVPEIHFNFFLISVEISFGNSSKNKNKNQSTVVI